jgi:hypothetical protein
MSFLLAMANVVCLMLYIKSTLYMPGVVAYVFTSFNLKDDQCPR